MNDYAKWQSPEMIQQILKCKRIAVVGLSSNHLRASNFVGYYLSRNGYEVIPVNPREDEVFGLKSYASVAEIPQPVDVVNVFRDPSAVPAIATDAVAAISEATDAVSALGDACGAKAITDA